MQLCKWRAYRLQLYKKAKTSVFSSSYCYSAVPWLGQFDSLFWCSSILLWEAEWTGIAFSFALLNHKPKKSSNSSKPYRCRPFVLGLLSILFALEFYWLLLFLSAPFSNEYLSALVLVRLYCKFEDGWVLSSGYPFFLCVLHVNGCRSVARFGPSPLPMRRTVLNE